MSTILKAGAVREDGRIFQGYSRPMLKNGTRACYERWVTPESFANYKRVNAKTVKSITNDPVRVQKRRESVKQARLSKRITPEGLDLDRRIKRDAARRYVAKNSDKIRKRVRAYKKKRWADASYRLEHLCRVRIRVAVKGIAKSANTAELIGCSIEHLIKHLESQFKEGMSWKNYGFRGWHVDHIKPCAAFDLSDSSQQRTCFHYTNLQPLWAEDNFKKGDSQ